MPDIDRFIRFMVIHDERWHMLSHYGRNVIRIEVGPYVRRVYVDHKGSAVATAYIKR